MNYGIQMKIDGAWQWVVGWRKSVEPVSHQRARTVKARLEREGAYPGAQAFRIRVIPGNKPPPGPRQIAREAKAEAAKLRLERDEARKAAEEMAAKLGLEVEW